MAGISPDCQRWWGWRLCGKCCDSSLPGPAMSTAITRTKGSELKAQEAANPARDESCGATISGRDTHPVCPVFTNLTNVWKGDWTVSLCNQRTQAPLPSQGDKQAKQKQLDIAASKPAWTGLTLCEMKAELLIRLAGRGRSQDSNRKWSVVFGWSSEELLKGSFQCTTLHHYHRSVALPVDEHARWRSVDE